MSWARLDDGCYFHAKVVAAGNEGFGCFCRLLAWSSHHLTDGEIPATVALAIAGDAHVLDRLCDVGMLSKTDAGYVVHDYLDYNPSARDVRKQRESQRKQRSIAGRASATARQRARNGAVEPPSNETSTPSHTHPDPDVRDQGVTLDEFATAVANAGIAIQTGRSEREWFSKLHPVDRSELDHALDCAARAKSKPRRAAYVLEIIESERRKAEDIAKQPKPPPRRQRQDDDSCDFVPPYLRPENNWSLQERLERERQQAAEAAAEVEP